MAHWNPYYDGSNHIYQEQNPQMYNQQNYAGVPFQQLEYNDYYIPNSYGNNSTDFNGTNLEYPGGAAEYTGGYNSEYSNRRINRDTNGANRGNTTLNYNMDTPNYDSNNLSYNSNISSTVRHNTSSTGYSRNSTGYHSNSTGYNTNSSNYNVNSFNSNPSGYKNSSDYNPTPAGYNKNSSGYNKPSSSYNPSPDYNTNASNYNTNVPNYNTNVSNYNTNASDYNTNAPEYKTNAPEYNSNAGHNATMEYTPNVSEYPMKLGEGSPKYKPVRIRTAQEIESEQFQKQYVSNLTATAMEFTPSTSWQKPIPSQTFNSNNYIKDNHSKDNRNKNKDNYNKDNYNKDNHSKDNYSKDNNRDSYNKDIYNKDNQNKVSKDGKYKKDKGSEEKNPESPGGDEKKFMRFTNRKYNEKYKTNDKFKNQSYRRNRDDQNTTESYNNAPRDYYSNKNNRYKNNGEYNRTYQDKNERSGGDGNVYSDSYRGNSKYTYRNNYKDDTKYENWRSNTPSMSLKEKPNDSQPKKNDKIDYQDRFKSLRDRKDKKLEDDDISQRDRLMEQVNKGTLECLVCCEIIRHTDKTWSCSKCYHIFHLRCSLKWAKASKDDNGWRCPACQHVAVELPNYYTCYCGQVEDPVYRSGDTAHSCGNVCGRVGVKPGCTHKCRLLCHPGPCPTCENLVLKVCNCGATKQMVKCSSNIPLVCKSICNKTLNCGVHKCQKICHTKECSNCEETIQQECFCGKLMRTIDCTKDQVDVKNYSCDKVCEKLLTCGNHSCKEVCHPGDCPPCERSIEVVKTCPCSKTELIQKRSSCLDPIPCCDKICGKEYICGVPSNPHRCKNLCHEGVCPVCNLTSLVQCRCGHMSCEIPCSELVSKADDARCKKKCTKKRSCAKHKCNQYCCIDIEHTCPLPCNRMLSCGQHRCELTCHKGRCPSCWRTSFEELYCECGASVIYPPVTCGTKRPNCTKPCSRQHECSHEVLHTCHSLPECPPCTVFTVKWCHGGHEKRSTIPCHQKDFSCGLPCNKDLPCGRHKCILPCHPGTCLKDGQICTQPCTVPRETCGHPCGLLCHDSICQESPCKEIVKVTCECGLRSTQRACVDMAGDYQRITNSVLASKMADMQLGHSIDIADIIGTTRKQVLKTLECNNDCKLIERNRRLAIGLQIRNPDLSAKLTPKYSDFMKQWAKKNPAFVQMVHEKLTELVQLAKQSKQKSRSYSFESMNRDKRHFIHEYCEHFGCESAAYDKEPNRNVVATAVGDKAWLPSLSILELLQRESGQRKVPGPILNRPLNSSSSTGNSQSVSLKISSAKVTSINATFSSTLQQRPKTPEGETIDYFDYDPAK